MNFLEVETVEFSKFTPYESQFGWFPSYLWFAVPVVLVALAVLVYLLQRRRESRAGDVFWQWAIALSGAAVTGLLLSVASFVSAVVGGQSEGFRAAERTFTEALEEQGFDNVAEPQPLFEQESFLMMQEGHVLNCVIPEERTEEVVEYGVLGERVNYVIDCSDPVTNESGDS